MTGTIPQTSASERMEAARQLADRIAARIRTLQPINSFTAQEAVDTLRALIIPPVTPSDEDLIRIFHRARHDANQQHAALGILGGGSAALEIALRAVFDAGIQAAHETWEPAE